MVKISRDHASCTRPPLPDFEVEAESVTFQFSATSSRPSRLNVWYSNFEANATAPTLFEKRGDIIVSNDGSFTLNIPVGAMITVSTVSGAVKGSPSKIPDSVPQFPLPYQDDFQGYPVSSEAKYFADQIGAFEIHPSTIGTRMVMRQMVPQLPIGWSDHGSNGPMTLIGMLEWQDIKIETMFHTPESTPLNTSACVGTRADQMWKQGIIFCVDRGSMGPYPWWTKTWWTNRSIKYSANRNSEDGH